MSKDTITVSMNVHDIPIVVETLEKADKEIERLNGALQTHEILLKSNVLEIERLNNIINELEKRCNEMLKLYDTFNDEQRFNNWKEYKVYGTILDWIEELKGSDKE